MNGTRKIVVQATIGLLITVLLGASAWIWNSLENKVESGFQENTMTHKDIWRGVRDADAQRQALAENVSRIETRQMMILDMVKETKADVKKLLERP